MKLTSNKIDFSNNVILITGADGMLGKSLFEKLLRNPLNKVIGVDFPVDLRDVEKVDNFFDFVRPDYVIHTAAKVGGVKANSKSLGDFYTDNIRINTNVLEYAKKYKVKKLVSLLSTCIYPDDIKYPLTEDQIHLGPPHSSNYAYAYAKRMLDIQSQAYRDQFGCNFITVVPNNLYGLFDNFHLENSHVIPAIIRKIYEAKNKGTSVEIWGDGTPLREFTYVDDIAEIILYMLEEYEGRDPINIGNTDEYSIREVVKIVADSLNFDGEIIWNTSMPNGQLRKPSSNQKFLNFINKQINYTTLKNGIKNTCDWFVKKYPDIRGI